MCCSYFMGDIFQAGIMVKLKFIRIDYDKKNL